MYTINPERRQDDKQEAIINEFLRKYYFSKVFQSARLVHEHNLQTAGVDVVCSDGKQRYNIDVKAQSSARYINSPRPTFSLELSTYNRHGTEEFDGWFLSPTLITDHYTFVWIHDAHVDERCRIRSCDDINCVEVMTVDKRRLKDYLVALLQKHGVDDISAVIQDIRCHDDTRIGVNDDVHFSYSPQLPEKPVNLIVYKRLLDKFSISGAAGHCYVTSDGVKTWSAGRE